jgi:SAM-dependent methyltransferase
LRNSVHELVDLGFLEAGGGEIWSRFALMPVEKGWIAHDFLSRQGEDHTDYVMGIGASSQLIASLTPPTGKKVLELACGIGWLAQNVAMSGRSVVATDLNARALDLGRFATRLRGIKGVDYRQGDTFSPVAGEHFDLIVANPPYVQSPGGNMTFREGRQGDPICARLLEQLPDFLAPGGIAIILINWQHHDDDDWSELPLSWVPAEGMRRWIFQSDCSSPADYALLWVSNDRRFQDESSMQEEISRWLNYYHDGNIERLSAGFLILQKCEPGEEWTRREQRAVGDIGANSGSEILRVIANESWLSKGGDLLGSRFSVPEGLRAEAAMKLVGNGWERETIRLISPARLSYDGQIDENILRLLAIIRGGGTANDMLSELRTNPEIAELPDLPERVTDLVRELVSNGMLIPSENS